MVELSQKGMVTGITDVFKTMSDPRKGKNIRYTFANILLAAFGGFFLQSPSFLAFQRMMQEKTGRNNAKSLFGVDPIPTDDQIRNVLDQARDEDLLMLYDYFFILLAAFESFGYLKDFRIKELGNTLLVAYDGTDHFSSPVLHCIACKVHTHEDGNKTYSHSMINPVIVSPEKKGIVISLPPEFITNKDGKKKQDCEINASKRLLKRDGKQLAKRNITIIGDDLYAHEPFLRDVLNAGCHFITVCKPDSHKTIYEWVNKTANEKTTDAFDGKRHILTTYKYMEQIPIREKTKKKDEPLLVNFVEVTIKERETGKQIYHNAFITSHQLQMATEKETEERLASIITCGRARWKTENENNNALKNYGYYLEHNFGHGETLASILTTLILLSFLMHTILSFTDHQYEAIRLKLTSKQIFFRDVSALTKYFPFRDFEQLTGFMLQSLTRPMTPVEILNFFQLQHKQPRETSPPGGEQQPESKEIA